MGFLDGLKDASLYLSFDRTGFERHAREFRAEDLALDLAGRVALVTGANSGIGRATAAALLERGAEVWLLCRDPGRGREAEAALQAAHPRGRARLAVLDVSDLGAVRAFADAAPARIDLLVHNAGVLPAARQLSRDGLELTLATHVAGPWTLTRRLEDRLRAAGSARVVWVASGGMYARRLSLRDLDWSARRWDGVAAYAQTKRMQVVLSGLLAERLRGTGVVSHAMHPGWADTPAVQTSLPRFWRFTRDRLRTPEQGADTVVWLCLAPLPGRTSGAFWFDRAPAPEHLLPWTREDPADRQELLRRCEGWAAS